MKTSYILVLTLIAAHLPAANILDQLECHDKVVRQGLESLVPAKDVDSLFGATNVDHFISNFGSKVHPPIWNSVTYFYGRYTLALQVPIAIDYENCGLSGATGSAVISVNEVIKVEISTSGNAQAWLKGGIGELDEKQWKKLAVRGGDWSVVRIPIFTNLPAIKGFDEYVRQSRAPIRNRKEGFDDPIRKTLEALRKQQAGVTDANDEKNAAGSIPAGAPLNEIECYGKAVRHGVDTLILPGEVNSLFGATNVDHLISKFGSKTQTPVWHSVSYFAGRYRLLLPCLSGWLTNL